MRRNETIEIAASDGGPGPAPAVAAPHAQTAAAVLAALGTRDDTGLADGEAERRLARFGANAVAARRGASLAGLLVHQFASPVVALLAAAAALALWFGDRAEAIAVVAVLAVNAAIGFATEWKAARSMAALRALGGRSARVRRDGRVRVIPAEALVPGDLVILEAGDAVPADLRIVEASRLSADESTLTGESMPVDKAVAPVPAEARLGDRLSMLFKGTAVTRGSATAVVVATGLSTELGRVTRLVMEADAGGSPLERSLARLSAQLVWVVIAVAATIAAVGLAGGQDPFLMIEAAIALAVAAIPEGLPIVATLALARGLWRMARRHALVERLSAVETLGATTVILTDKTGTLTENRMTVRRLALTSGEIDLGAAAAGRLAGDAQARQLLTLAVLCNDAHLDAAGDGGNGDPMEVALLRAGRHAGLKRAALLAAHPAAAKHAFDSAGRMMATVHGAAAGFLVAVKGAPEAVIAAANRVVADHGETALDAEARAAWLERADLLARHGLRTLAVARKTATRADDEPYADLVLVGLIGLEDPARADVPEAVRACRRAGIRVVMVTGDHAVTARSIARAVGLVDEDDGVAEGRAVDGVIAAGPAALARVGVFARVSPAEKLALVKAYQAAGAVVAMTGDGVNDAPALRQADIGVAMGLRGTDVAREAAAMVLLDDAFPTIVRAIGQGRVIFANIRRFVAYLLACNLSEVMVVAIAVASTLPLPLQPLQILYLNLVTDVFPAFALAMGEGEAGVLDRPPRDPREPILGRSQWLAILLHGAALGAGTFAALTAAHHLGFDDRQTVTATFLTLAFAQLWHVFDMRDARSHPLVNEITANPYVWAALALCAGLLAIPPYWPAAAGLLLLAPPDGAMWAVVLAASLAPLVLSQAVAAVLGRHEPEARP